MASSTKLKQKKKRGKHLLLVLAILILLLLLLVGLWFLFIRQDAVETIESADIIVDTIVPQPDTPKDTVIKDTTPTQKIIPKKVPPKVIEKRDTLPKDTIVVEPPDPCEKDTIPPWVYPDPSGGLHYGTVSLYLIASKSCEIQWKFDHEDSWKQYNNEKITIEKTVTLSFKAKDSCDNRMDVRHERYEIKQPELSKFCPKGMAHIKIGTTQFCIDRYEWPNKKDARPMSHISIYHAMDSCFTRKKRLCTSDEWGLACAGAYSWKYPYGDQYEPKACATRDSTVLPSGKKAECRGYFGIFDMSGNLAEWTSTKSKKNPKFFNVMGGFWDSGPQSTCFSPRYSYFPRNRHNPVGFRCCKDVNK